MQERKRLTAVALVGVLCVSSLPSVALPRRERDFRIFRK